MKITAFTTCWRYARHLRRHLGWRDELDRWIVITHPTDTETIELGRAAGLELVVTDAFSRHPRAYFDKALALSETIESVGPCDWILQVDADVGPPAGWRRCVEENARVGFIYGTGRGGVMGVRPGGPRVDGELGGFFHLWNAWDPIWTADPTLGSWVSAGAYDTVFEQRWPRLNRVRLPIMLTHTGKRDTDWCGVGNVAGMRDLLLARNARGMLHERLDRSPSTI